MAVRVFVQEDDELVIQGESFKLRPLPSAKALNLRAMLQDVNLEKVLEDVSEGLSQDMAFSEELIVLGENLSSKFRYGLIAYALQIEEGTEEYKRLTSAIDKAGFKEIWFDIEQIIEINGFKWLEKMVKNLTEALTPNLPELGKSVSRLLTKYSERNELLDKLDQKLETVRSTGSNISSLNSQESHSTLDQHTPSTP